MKRCASLLGLAGLGVLLSTGCAQYTYYGETLSMTDSDTMPVSKVLAAPASYEGQKIRVTGEVADLCKGRGCWMALTDDKTNESLFVKFTCKIEGRLIPVEALGHKAVAEGTLAMEEVSEEQAKHFRECAGASAEELAKIKGPQKMLTLSSYGAGIKGLAKAEGQAEGSCPHEEGHEHGEAKAQT